jgi:hypothetical protein
METGINEILNGTGTKTSKIQKLILLGLTRKRIAELVTAGNYGFVQNVYAKMKEQGLLSASVQRSFNRRFGVEIEAYNVDRQTLAGRLNREGINCEVESYGHSQCEHWKIVSDASLSGNSTFELVSPVLKGEQGMEELEKVCRVLGECGARVNRSCGTHIHFDAHGMGLRTWKNIFINYARLENVIDGFMPESRKGDSNTYCKGFKNFTNFEQKIEQATTLSNIANSVFYGNRYFKINAQSYARHKTIEFRQHGGTVEYKKISNWIHFLDSLVSRSAGGLIENATLDGISEFNAQETVNYLKDRTRKFNNSNNG